MDKIPTWVAKQLVRAIRDGFWGKLTLNFKNGHIHTIEKFQTIKPEEDHP